MFRKCVSLSVVMVMILSLSACAGAAPVEEEVEVVVEVLCSLTTHASPSGSGTISPSSGKYDSGDRITLTATPASGYEFDRWSGTDSNYTNPTTVTMNSNRSIIAYFTEIKYSLSTIVNPPGSGSISPSSGTYTSGTQVTLTATPASSRYVFDHWSRDVSGTSSMVTVTMNSNKNIIANFRDLCPQRIELTLRGAVPGFQTYSIGFSSYLSAGERVEGSIQWETTFFSGWRIEIIDPQGNVQSSRELDRTSIDLVFDATQSGEWTIKLTNLGDIYIHHGVMEICPPGW